MCRYDLGLISGALLTIRDDIGAGDAAQAAIVGAAKAGAVIGTYAGGAAMYSAGRCRTIAISSLLFIAGPIVMALANSVAQLVVGRLCIGLGIGMSAGATYTRMTHLCRRSNCMLHNMVAIRCAWSASSVLCVHAVVVPAYLAEMAPAHLRGAAVSTYEAMLCVGMLASILVDAALQACCSMHTFLHTRLSTQLVWHLPLTHHLCDQLQTIASAAVLCKNQGRALPTQSVLYRM